MKELLFFNTPLWSHAVTFIIAWCLGFFCCGLMSGEKIQISQLERSIKYLIMMFFSIAIARASFGFAEWPPIEITALFGGLAGILDERVGEFFSNKKNEK